MFEQQLIVPSPLAFAYARREHADHEIFDMIKEFYEKDPEAELSLPKEISADQLQRAALRTEKIIRLKDMPNIAFMIERQFDKQTLASQSAPSLSSIIPSEVTFTMDDIYKISEDFAESELMDNGYKEAILYSTDCIWRQTEAAQRLALSQNLAPEAFFERENLYREMISQIYNPEDYVSIFFNLARRISPDSINDIVLAFATGVGGLAFKDPSELKANIEELKKELAVDQHFLKNIQKTTANQKRSFYAFGLYQLGRFWGMTGVQKLPIDAQIYLQSTSSY